MTEAMFRGVTIDSVHSLDLDDALWVERNERGWRVTVCVSDVSSAVGMGSDEDVRAAELGFTRYRSTSVRKAMLPLALSHQRLSLLHGQERRVMSVAMDLMHDLEMERMTISCGMLDNVARLSHGQVGVMLQASDTATGTMLRDAWKLASALLERRKSKGALAFFSQVSGTTTDEEGNLVDLGCRGGDSQAHFIVQELMILANGHLSDRCASEGWPIMFRNHRPSPAADRQALVEDIDEMAGGGAHAETAGRRMRLLLGRPRLGSKATGHYHLCRKASSFRGRI